MVGKSAYRNEWIAEKLDRINLTVPKGRKEISRKKAGDRARRPVRVFFICFMILYLISGNPAYRIFGMMICGGIPHA